MSTRRILSVLFIAAELIALSSCVSDTSTAVTGPMKIIDLPSGATSGQAIGINNKNQIVGTFR